MKRKRGVPGVLLTEQDKGIFRRWYPVLLQEGAISPELRTVLKKINIQARSPERHGTRPVETYLSVNEAEALVKGAELMGRGRMTTHGYPPGGLVKKDIFREALLKIGIKRQDVAAAAAAKEKKFDESIRLMLERSPGLTAKEIARRLRAPYHIVRPYMHKYIGDLKAHHAQVMEARNERLRRGMEAFAREGKTAKEVAELLNIPSATFHRRAKEFGITFRRQNAAAPVGLPREYSPAAKRLWRQKSVRLDSPSAQKLMAFEKDPRLARMREIRNRTADAYYDPKLSLGEAAARLGVSKTEVNQRITRYGFPTRKEVNRAAGVRHYHWGRPRKKTRF